MARAFGVRRSLLPLAAIACVSVACARPETAADRHASEMRDAVARIEAEHDRLDRRAFDLDTAVAEERAASGSASAPGTPVPRVVQLGGPDDPGDADPNDATARPEIKVVGPGGGRPSRSPVARGEARIGFADEAPAGDPSPTAPAAVPQPAEDAQKAYEDALAKVQSKAYPEALEGFTTFLAKWPDHPYAENATYWRGEVFYAQGDFERAKKELETVVARYPSGSKAPAALLKIGMCHEKAGSAPRARETWARLRREYPRSEAARKIPKETR